MPRDGSTSLITYSNASNFAVFSHVRNFVLQNQLCEMFNTRFAKSSNEEAEEDETEEEAKKRKQHSLSKVENKDLNLLKMEGIIFSVVYISIGG